MIGNARTVDAADRSFDESSRILLGVVEQMRRCTHFLPRFLSDGLSFSAHSLINSTMPKATSSGIESRLAGFLTIMSEEAI